MLGSNKQLKTENHLKGLGRSSIDWRVDANSGTNAIQWYDNREVQFASTYIGHEQRNQVKHWSAEENEIIEIECPAMVEEYKSHTGGIDLCYILLALYRIRLRTCKYYMHMIYYCMGISITNGWLLYRRYCEQKHVSNKRPNQFVSISIERRKCSSSGQQEKRYPQVRAPFIIIHPQWSFSCQEALLCSISYSC